MVSKNKILLGQIIINFVLALTMSQSGLADVVNPQLSRSRNLLTEIIELLEYEPPSRGKPGDTADAGSRGSCDFLAIVPAHQYGLTAAEHPTLWFYLKSQPSLPKSVHLELQNEQNNIVYQTTFELNQTARIIDFRLPQTAPPLVIGQKYKWILSYGGINHEMYTSGKIERIALAPEIESQLKQATSRERLQILIKKRLWYDTFTELNQLRQTNPQDTELNVAWTTLIDRTFRSKNCLVSNHEK
ncbi:hypothetical protein NIES2119_13945 [[Phormidium ambiguum] IAM M-71]|uniref:DUF928 domain-containing protein n=1 Tax=[Phormidium ambiguum] IAM M-71 TaxID=454136 RepID=A0A1U7IJL9_9CYAN|nr:DUF928 domain-containing protein [Phormidium ambiguum]OKH37346.1 hypothetical protein NIES2119_13945 [Phormidium ambiguum IAM M-71]